jgi:hypothetical protein
MTYLRNGYHGCKQGMFHVAEEHGLKTLREGDLKEWPIPIVCDILHNVTTIVERSFIFIPTYPVEDDE